MNRVQTRPHSMHRIKTIIALLVAVGLSCAALDTCATEFQPVAVPAVESFPMADVSELQRLLAEKDAELLALRRQLGIDTSSLVATRDAELTEWSAEPADDLAPLFDDTVDRPWLDQLSLFAGIDGSKQPQDFGINAHFGGRAHVNWARPLVEAWGLGVQIGTALNYSDNAVKVIDRIGGPGSRNQSFTTVGLFQRFDGGWLWGGVYDFLVEDYVGRVNLGQWRGRLGYQRSWANEFGGLFAISQNSDRTNFITTPVRLAPITNGSLYWRHTWENSAQTAFWFGVAHGHGQGNIALGDLPRMRERLVFGADINVPLNDFFALFGEANFLMPASTGTVDAYLGLAFYPGGRAYGNATRRFSPALPVANNNSMMIDLSR